MASAIDHGAWPLASPASVTVSGRSCPADCGRGAGAVCGNTHVPPDDTTGRSRFIAIALLLGVVAFVAETRRPATATPIRPPVSHIVVLDCHDIHCFGFWWRRCSSIQAQPSLLKWKKRTGRDDAAAAIALGQLCLVLGLSPRAAGFATRISASGSGPSEVDLRSVHVGPGDVPDRSAHDVGLARDRLLRPGAIGASA